MIAFWIREIAGWLLVLVGLYAFLLCVMFVFSRQVVEAGIIGMMGIMIYRGGIHLVKVATAARVVLLESKSSSPKK